MKKSISMPAVIGLVAAVVVLAGLMIYRSQPRYDLPVPMTQQPPAMPPLVQGPDGRMRPATSP